MGRTLSFFILLLGILRPAVGGATPANKIILHPKLMIEINSVLKTSENLHQALVLENEDQIEIGLRDVISQLERAKRLSHLAKDHERRHLIRVLEAALEQFDLSLSAYGEDKQLHLQDGMNQMVNLVRMYQVERSYNIFFCDKDKLSWVQRGTKPENPFRGPASIKACGLRVTDH